MGDALKVPDEPVLAERVLGRVLRIERVNKNGRAVNIDISIGIWPILNPLLAYLARVRALVFRVRQ